MNDIFKLLAQAELQTTETEVFLSKIRQDHKVFTEEFTSRTKLLFEQYDRNKKSLLEMTVGLVNTTVLLAQKVQLLIPHGDIEYTPTQNKSSGWREIIVISADNGSIHQSIPGLGIRRVITAEQLSQTYKVSSFCTLVIEYTGQMMKKQLGDSAVLKEAIGEYLRQIKDLVI